LYAHGYIESPAEESVSVIVDAYLKRGDHNVLVLDWTELADGHYMFEALPNTKRVNFIQMLSFLLIDLSLFFVVIFQLGWALGDVLLKLFDHGLDINKFHLIGYSLGGQLIGFIGRSVIKKSKKKVKLKR
jgi:pancreatic triacylglycerol lipase